MYSSNRFNRFGNNTLSNLEQKGVFKKPEVDEYYTELLPELQTLAETNYKNDYLIVKGLNDMLTIKHRNNCINKHREAIQKEKDRTNSKRRIK